MLCPYSFVLLPGSGRSCSLSLIRRVNRHCMASFGQRLVRSPGKPVHLSIK